MAHRLRFAVALERLSILLKQVAPAAVLWGAGTAIGEIPPYAVAMHAARAGEKNSDVEQMLSVGLLHWPCARSWS